MKLRFEQMQVYTRTDRTARTRRDVINFCGCEEPLSLKEKIRLCKAMYGYVRLCRAGMAMYGYIWLCRAVYGYVGLCRAV